MKKTIGTTILATTLALGLFAAEANVANDELTAESTKTEVSQDLENMEKNMETIKKQNLLEKIGQFFDDGTGRAAGQCSSSVFKCSLLSGYRL